MTLCFSHLCFLIYLPIFLLALRLIMPYCYLYHYAQLMLNKYYFCKTSVHSFLGLSNMASPSPSTPHPHPDSKCGLGLVFSNENNNPNVVGSSSLPLFNTKPMSPLSFSPKKKDPCGLGFVDDMGGGVDDGLVSCTESLGFESCNDDSYTDFCEEEIRDRWRNNKKRGEGKRSEDKRNKKFPPPLPSLNQNGQPCFYLRPVRENGRLELTEVWIHRPEVLRAVRENGRLRLHLVSSDGCCNFNEDEEIQQEVHDLHAEEEEEEEGMDVELWNYGVNGEGSRRCHEMVNYHHHGINGHHSLHAWRQPCVSIR
ncbi:hypothetical protein HRI_001596700 [Hibiscus trionum]|uniref:FAF domain-containing protein n=1 Tax=Hibiscus trionum TaxID=183268 RepID=A0A9W7HKB8_HIBTR|nr:hypothetical protein HRI_001596700 [Hibiscus trionum]